MENLRNAAPSEIGGYPVLDVRDYKKKVITDSKSGETMPTGLPESDVLYYDLPENSWVCVRPSGTEPKIKVYFGIKADSLEKSVEESKKLGECAVKMLGLE